VIPGTWRRIRGAAGWALVAVLVYLSWPAALGGHLSLVVVSGHSMDGTYRSGDLLMAWPHADYHVGEIVVYKIPKGEPASGLRVVHRIIAKKDGHFTSQGDNRTTPDFWRPTVNDVVGHPFLRIRAGGLALKWLISPIALALVCGVCVYMAVVGKDDRAEAADDEDDESEDDDPCEEADSEDIGAEQAADEEEAREPEPVLPR
jgi:signal peptidase I